MRKLLLVIFLLLSPILSSFSPERIKEEKKHDVIFYIEKPTPIVRMNIKKSVITNINIDHILKSDSLYTDVLSSIKKFEGLRLTSYICPANQKTIGYGHCIKSTDNLGDTITLAQAEKLLKQDFNHAIAFVVKKVKGLPIEKDNNKILALAHFAFNVGVGTFEKSTILDNIKDNKSIDDVLLQYIHYRNKDKQLIESNYLKQIRQYEVNLFNGVS